MHLRDLIKSRWADAGLYAMPNLRLQTFLKHVDEHPLECWDEFITLFRGQFYDLYDLLVPPLVTAEDRLLRAVLIQRADLKRPEELATMKDFVRIADPIAHERELEMIARRGHPGLLAEMKAAGKLTPEIEARLHPVVPRGRPVTNVRVAAAPPPPPPRTGPRRGARSTGPQE